MASPGSNESYPFHIIRTPIISAPTCLHVHVHVAGVCIRNHRNLYNEHTHFKAILLSLFVVVIIILRVLFDTFVLNWRPG